VADPAERVAARAHVDAPELELEQRVHPQVLARATVLEHDARAVQAWGATVRGAYGTAVAGTRTQYVLYVGPWGQAALRPRYVPNGGPGRMRQLRCRPAEVSVTKSSVIMCAAAAAGGVRGRVGLCTRAAVLCTCAAVHMRAGRSVGPAWLTGHAESLLQVLLEREADILTERVRAAPSGRAVRSEWRAAVGSGHRRCSVAPRKAPKWRFQWARSSLLLLKSPPTDGK